MRVFRTAVPSLFLLLLATPAVAGEADASDDAKARGLHRELRLLSEELDFLRDAPVAERQERSLVVGERLARLAKRTRGLEGRVAEDTAEWIRALRTSFLRLEDEEMRSVAASRPRVEDDLLPRALTFMEDECADARLIGDGSWQGTVSGLTEDPIEACRSPAYDGWFRYRADADGWYKVGRDVLYSVRWEVHSSCQSGPLTCVNPLTDHPWFGSFAWYQEAGTEVLLRAVYDYPFDYEEDFVFSVGPTAGVEGRVTDLEGAALAGITITASRNGSSFEAMTGNDGRYRIVGLDPGSTRVWASDYEQEWAGVVWPGVVCSWECHPEDGEGIELHSGEITTEIDFQLGRVASLSGSVVKASNGRAGGGSVRTHDAAGRVIGYPQYLDSEGRWSLSGLGPGDVFLVMHGGYGIPSQVWPGVECEGECDPLNGEPIRLEHGQDLVGFDFVADDSGTCLEDDETLCIDEDYESRFRVSTRLESAAGGGIDRPAGVLEVYSVNLQGGLFYFFEEDNPEILVKVLDGCILNNHYWVFYAAATSLGFELTVEDVVAGRSKTYVNPDGTPAATVTDIEAIPCF